MTEIPDRIPQDAPGLIPPIGWILVQMPDGLFWVDPTLLKARAPDPNRLTEAQKQRIRNFKKRLGPFDKASLKQTYDNFSIDHNPDTEIAVMEKVADIFELEITRRPGATDAEKHLVYTAVLMCSIIGDVYKVISVSPQLKHLSNLDRIAEAWKTQ